MAYAYDVNIQELYNDLDYELFRNWGLTPFSIHGTRRHRRGRRHFDRSRGRRMGRGRGRFSNRPELPLHSDLIESQKVFIANIDKFISEEILLASLKKFANVEGVKIIRRYNYNPSPAVYGFAKLASDEDTKILLSLSGSDLQPIGSSRRMVIKPAIKEFKLPGAPGYVRPVLDDRDFELEPPNPNEPCAHVLNDDVLLKIFDYLPVKKLIAVERVCRRWQNLVHLNFRKLAKFDIEADIAQFWKTNRLPGMLTAVSKVLLLSGENIRKLVIDAFHFEDSVKLLRIIAQLCPSLESITVKNMMRLDENNSYLVELVSSCKNLTECRFLASSFCDSSFKIIMEGIPNLQNLHLNQTRIKGEYMSMLPSSLKELRLGEIRCMKPHTFDKLHQCTNLEILVLEKLLLPGSVITSVGKSCLNLKVLVVDVTTDYEKIDLSNFKSLKTLHFNSVNYSVIKLIKDLPQLEELKLHGIINERENDLVDFSALTNLKFLVLPSATKCSFGQASLQTIALCKNLEKLHLPFYANVKEVVLSCLKKCPKLKELESPHISLTSTDISSFVEATKRKTHRIKLVIGLDKSALDEIEKLEEAKYDIEMLDTFNLFSNMDSPPYGMDDDDGHSYFSDDSCHSDEFNYDSIFDDYLNMHELELDDWPPFNLSFLNNFEGLYLHSDDSELEDLDHLL